MTESTTAVLDTTDAPVADVAETVAAAVPETAAPVAVSFPHANDNNVPVADAMTRFAELYAFGTENPALRDDLDARAFKQFVRALTAPVADDAQTEIKFDLPRYGDSGLDYWGDPIGSLRYTRERATMLAHIAEANVVASELLFGRYVYPPTKGTTVSRRKSHFVTLRGTRSDIERALTMYRLVARRAIHDAYIGEHQAPLGTVFSPSVRNAPAQQTKIRRTFMRSFSQALGGALQAASDKVNRKQAESLLDRKTAAERHLTEFLAENAAANQARSEDAQIEVETGE